MADVEFTEREKRSFKRNGFLVCEDLLDSDLVERASDAVWDGIPYERHDHEALVETPERIENAWDHVEDDAPFAEINRQLLPYAETLIRGDVAPPGDGLQLALRFPSGEQDDADPYPSAGREHGHIDGYGPSFDRNHEVSHFQVAAAVYLDRVEPRGGGFTVWPGSHWHAGAYYTDNHLESLVGHPALPGLERADGEWTGEFERCERYDEQFDPLEIHGPAGTVVLWHGALQHCGGVNRSRNLRLAAIKRFRRTDADEIKREAFANPFEYHRLDDVELAP